MEKYEGLPGIDTGVADTFETSDIDSDSDPEVIPLSNEDIDTTPVDTDLIRKNLETNNLNRIPNFSGDITTRLGYSGYSNINQESIEEKLARIARELEEIENVPQNSKIDRLKLWRDKIDTKKDFDIYTKELTSLFDHLSIKEFTKSDVTQSNQYPRVNNEILQLESKLNDLESYIGGNRTNSIKDTLSDLTRKVNIIHNPEYKIDDVHDKIKELDKEYEKILAKRKLFDIDSVEIEENSNEKIDKLYENLPNFEKCNATIPLILKRLKTLHQVHSDLGNSVNIVKNLDSTLKKMDFDYNQWNDSLKIVNKTLSTYESSFDENKTVILSQLDKLSERFDRLG